MDDINPIQTFTLEHDGVRLAAARLEGRSGPGVPVFVWLSGYGSDMNGFKASWLTQQCQVWSLPLLKVDYRGTGQSGGDFAAATISDWVADMLFAIEQLTDGPVVLVGSSLGAWIALRVAAACPRVAALLLVSAAPDFTRKYWEDCTPDQQAEWQATGMRTLGHNGLGLSYKLVADAAENHLVLDAPIAFDGPVSLLHGMKDDVVAASVAHRLMDRLTSTDVSLHLVKDGDHALRRPDDLALLWQELTRLWDKTTILQPVEEIADEDDGGLSLLLGDF